MIGGTVMRFRTQLSRTRPSSVVFDAGRRPPGLLAELTKAGNRRLHARIPFTRPSLAGMGSGTSGVRCDRARSVLLLYGQYDWSRPSERDAIGVVRGAQSRTVMDAGHFLSLDAPDGGSRGRAGVRDHDSPRDVTMAPVHVRLMRDDDLQSAERASAQTFFEADRLTRRVGEQSPNRRRLRTRSGGSSG